MPARAREVDREPSRHLASEHAPRRRPRPDARRGHRLVGVGVDRPLHGDAPERSRVGRGRSVELERHSRSLQPWLRAAAAGECAGCGDARRASCARLRARRLVVRPRRLLVGAEYRRQRPVRHDRRGDGSSPPARARARPRVRHLDGRARERARGRTGSRDHRRRAFDMRARRRRDPSQQLPARRGVRDREAPHACSRTQARRFREPGRGRRVRSRADRGGPGRPDDSRRPRTPLARLRAPQRRARRARRSRAGAERRRGDRGRAIRERGSVVSAAQLHPVRPVLDRARGRRQRIVDAR